MDLWIDAEPPYSGKTLVTEFKWVFPDDFDHETAKALVLEASRPCGGATIKYFIALARSKKIPDIDSDNADKYLMTFVRDVMEYCELAVIASLEDFRLHDPRPREQRPFFPTIDQIRENSQMYHTSILQAQRYFKDNQHGGTNEI